jgi:hypothetical protein
MIEVAGEQAITLVGIEVIVGIAVFEQLATCGTSRNV